ncbi:MAG: CPBP family intramembrane glutamic endopeptidase [Bacteroidota bacterium]
MEKRAVIAILTIAAFVVAQKLAEFLKLFDWFIELEAFERGVVYKLLAYVVLPLVVLAMFHGLRNMFDMAGLTRAKFKTGIKVGFIGTLPMLLGAGYLDHFDLTVNLPAIMAGCLLAAVGEELLFRAMLFGQLFRHARWGFLVAGMASAVLFSFGHLYQADSIGSVVGILLVTFMGGMWFSWLYVEYGYNLWVPISYHFFMNLSWTIFDVSDTALGGVAPNIFRAATIALSIYLTIRHKRKNGEKWTVTGRRWWSGRTSPTTDNQSAQPLKFKTGTP